MVSIIRWLVIVLPLLMMVVASEQKSNALTKDQVWICVKWQWAGTVAHGKVNCTEWAKQDCSNRLHKDICKRGGS
jgi:hypothetical protein